MTHPYVNAYLRMDTNCILEGLLLEWNIVTGTPANVSPNLSKIKEPKGLHRALPYLPKLSPSALARRLKTISANSPYFALFPQTYIQV